MTTSSTFSRRVSLSQSVSKDNYDQNSLSSPIFRLSSSLNRNAIHFGFLFAHGRIPCFSLPKRSGRGGRGGKSEILMQLSSCVIHISQVPQQHECLAYRITYRERSAHCGKLLTVTILAGPSLSQRNIFALV